MSDQGTYNTVNVTAVHDNLDQEIIRITDDRLRRIVEEHLRKKQSIQDSLAIAGLFFTSLTTLLSSQFKNDFFISSNRLDSIYFVLTVASFFWLLFSLNKCRKSPSTDDLIIKIKNKNV